MFLGNTLIIISAFDFNELLSYIQEHKMTKLYLVPPIVVRLVKDPATAKYDLSRMEQITCGAAPLASDTMAMLRSKFNGVAFKQGKLLSI
jgi:4-coumarate--CoA ligase